MFHGHPWGAGEESVYRMPLLSPFSALIGNEESESDESDLTGAPVSDSHLAQPGIWTLSLQAAHIWLGCCRLYDRPLWHTTRISPPVSESSPRVSTLFPR
jgi:hypothetical protein